MKDFLSQFQLLHAEGERKHTCPMFCTRTHNRTHFELSNRSKYAIDDALLMFSPHTSRELNCTLPHACSGLRSKMLAVSQSTYILSLTIYDFFLIESRHLRRRVKIGEKKAVLTNIHNGDDDSHRLKGERNPSFNGCQATMPSSGEESLSIMNGGRHFVQIMYGPPRIPSIHP